LTEEQENNDNELFFEQQD
jgi:hypothetical protein